MIRLLFYPINIVNRKLNLFKQDINSFSDLKHIDKETFFEILRYGITGVINTAIYAVSGLTLHHIFNLEPLHANFIAIILSIITGFIGHNFYTYRQEKMQFSSFMRFIVIQILALLISQSIVFIIVNMLGLIYEVALLLSIAVLPPFVWGMGHLWVFKGKKRIKKTKNKQSSHL
ncbi:MAG: GtrA family protein [Alphaproteobacteria bacterium]|nr:GtrA family protein [Alphaproteobacteria bacterium]